MNSLVAVCLVLIGAGWQETTLIPPPFWHDLGYHRASKFYLDMYLGGDFHYDDPQGIACEKLRVEDDTTTSQDDHILSVFAVNSGTGQILYNTGMRKLSVYGREGSGDGEFRHPHGVAVNRAGDVYIADTDNGRIVRLLYLKDGLQFVRSSGGIARPYGVALDSRGQVYVTDSSASQVLVLDTMGKVVQRWAGMEAPTGIAVLDAWAARNYGSSDFAVVIDRNGTRVNKLSRTGELIASVQARDIGLVSARFAYCAVDCYGSIYVTDEENDQIHKFDSELHYLVSFGRTGTGDGEFRSPRGITIGRQFGQVFVAEAEGGQYLWLGLDAYMIGCFPSVMARDQPGTTIALYSTEMADLTINIYGRNGKLVRNLFPSESREKPGDVLIVWDGRDDKGVPVPPGDYQVKASLRPTYGGQRRSLKKELTTTVKRT